jgi:hypothetical protein
MNIGYVVTFLPLCDPVIVQCIREIETRILIDGKLEDTRKKTELENV